MSKVQPFFDSALMATPRSLIESDPSWAKDFYDYTSDIRSDSRFTAGLKWNPAWARMGLFAWKPRLILEVLSSSGVASGDVVFYHDSDSEKYPDYLYRVPYWSRWLRRRMKSVDVLVFRDNRAPLMSDTKPELWEQFFSLSEAQRLKHVWAGALVVKKTAAGVDFVEKWKDLASHSENLLPFTKVNEDANFARHAPDQAILACLRHAAPKFNSAPKVEEVFLGGSRKIPPESGLGSRIRTAVRGTLNK